MTENKLLLIMQSLLIAQNEINSSSIELSEIPLSNDLDKINSDLMEVIQKLKKLRK